jgi:hypothetical protein
VLIVPLVFYGKRVTAEPEGGATLFCGLCVETREHEVMRLSERATLYGIVEFGQAQVSHVSRCGACEHVTWIDPPGAPAPPRRRSDLDAFLRAHASIRLTAPWTLRDASICAALVLTAALASYGLDRTLGLSGAGIGLFVGLGPAVLFTYLGLTRARLERHLAAELAPKIARLLARTGVPMRALAPRARQLGAPHLARLFESRAFESLAGTRSAYR